MFTTIQGSAHDIAQVADKSVQLVVTSPPYYSLRKYDGEQEIEWQEMSYSPMPGLPPITIPAQRAALGLEKDPFSYIGHLILCLREWRRVLRDDGLCFVNLGDSFASNGTPGKRISGDHPRDCQCSYCQMSYGKRSLSPGLKPKDLMQIPQRFALAAQADGWFVRNDIIWSKPNPMPESVQDRFTRSHEYIYMLAKSERYYFDSEAVKEAVKPLTAAAGGWQGRAMRSQNFGAKSIHENHQDIQGRVYVPNPTGRNRRTVWELATRPFGAAHFACFPPEIPEICIRAGTSARGCCPDCSAPWRRVVERSGSYHTGNTVPKNQGREEQGLQSATSGLGQAGWRKNEPPMATTTGWEPTCQCNAGEPTSCVVLDPFSGSGTTGKVAVRLGRRYVGVDLSEKYLTEITEARMGAGVQMELNW